jgi:hypothetical protein
MQRATWRPVVMREAAETGTPTRYNDRHAKRSPETPQRASQDAAAGRVGSPPRSAKAHRHEAGRDGRSCRVASTAAASMLRRCCRRSRCLDMNSRTGCDCNSKRCTGCNRQAHYPREGCSMDLARLRCACEPHIGEERAARRYLAATSVLCCNALQLCRVAMQRAIIVPAGAAQSGSRRCARVQDARRHRGRAGAHYRHAPIQGAHACMHASTLTHARM